MRVPCEFGAIRTAIDKQLLCGRYFPSDLYGKPGISQEIAERLATLEPLGDKRLDYPPPINANELRVMLGMEAVA
jgi:hypothetical protein